MNSLYIYILIVGTLIFSSIPLFLSNSTEDTTFLNISRIILFFLSLIIITKGVLRKDKFIFSAKLWPFYLFFFLYIFRLIWDLFIDPIPFFGQNLDPETIKSQSYYMSQFLGIVFVPTIGVLFLDIKKVNQEKLLNYIYNTLLLFLTFSIYSLYQVLDQDQYCARCTTLTISELTYGNYGSMLSIFSIYRLINIEKSNNYISIIGFSVGIITIMSSGSRSPFLGMVLIIVYMLFQKLNFTKFFLTLSFITIILYNFIIDLLLIVNSFIPNTFADRILLAFTYLDEGSTRGDLISAGLNEFLQSPFFGSGFLIQTSPMQGSYPHNLIIEALMSTGMFGGLIFLYLIVSVFKLILLNRNTDQEWIGILFIQFFIFGLFSGNLFTSIFFWTSLTLVLKTYYLEN